MGRLAEQNWRRVRRFTWLACLAPAAILSAQYDPVSSLESARVYGGFHIYAYYYVDILVGAPTVQRTSVIVDTGSSLMGFPCTDCDHCSQEHLDPAFNISKSRTARWLECPSDCHALACSSGRCSYNQAYSEGSSVAGTYFRDTVELGDTFHPQLPVRAKLGCHNEERKLFYDQLADGIMGLAPTGQGGEPTILHDLFKDREHIESKIFSLCLSLWGGMLTIGGWNESYHSDHQHETTNTSIVWLEMMPSTYYYVFLTEIWLDTMPVGLGQGSIGDAIVDSGTTFTLFPSPLYDTIVADIATHCFENNRCGAVQKTPNCWRLLQPDDGPVLFPKLTLHFADHQVAQWAAPMYMHQKGYPLSGDVWCYSFDRSIDNMVVLGISWMLQRDVIFDIKGQRLGIAPANCPFNFRKVQNRQVRKPRKHSRRSHSPASGSSSRARIMQKSDTYQRFRRQPEVVLDDWQAKPSTINEVELTNSGRVDAPGAADSLTCATAGLVVVSLFGVVARVRGRSVQAHKESSGGPNSEQGQWVARE